MAFSFRQETTIAKKYVWQTLRNFAEFTILMEDSANCALSILKNIVEDRRKKHMFQTFF